MSQERLTRQELSWLLAQEARSAADLLRRGVDTLKKSLPPTAPSTEISTSLDALDDTMRALSSLNVGEKSHSRRGKIDIAALLLELLPGAKVELEPGRGTEIFGDELEIRRMLQLFLALGDAAGETRVAREGEVIRIAAMLGPDSSGGSKTEHAFVHRMATRHGGKLELDGGHVVLSLPADADIERREVEELRRELAAAQEQGEAYARELASMFATAPASGPEPPLDRSEDVRNFAQGLSDALARGADPQVLGAALRLVGSLPDPEPPSKIDPSVVAGDVEGPAAWLGALIALVGAEGGTAKVTSESGLHVVATGPSVAFLALARALGLQVRVQGGDVVVQLRGRA